MGRYDALYQSSPPPPLTVPAKPARPSVSRRNPEAVRPNPAPEPPPVRAHRSDEPNARTDAATETLLDEITGGAPAQRRLTERYSFEIYTDQKPRIEEVQYRFKQRTGTKLSASRIIREAIDAYLPKALTLLADQSNDTERAAATER